MEVFMKKIFLLFIAFALFSQQPIQTQSMAMGPKRLFQCTFMSEQSKCSSQERTKARKWLMITSAAVIAAVGATLGIALTKRQIDARKLGLNEDQGAISDAERTTLVFGINRELSQLNSTSLPLTMSYIQENISGLNNKDLKIIDFNPLLSYAINNRLDAQNQTTLIGIIGTLRQRNYPFDENLYRKAKEYVPGLP